MLARDARERWRTGLAHDLQQFAVENVDHGFNAGLTERSQASDLGPADADGGCAECQGFEHIGAAANAAVEQHWNASGDRGSDFRQAVERRTGAMDVTRETSRPANMGVLCTGSCELSMGQSLQVRLSVRIARVNVSLCNRPIIGWIKLLPDRCATRFGDRLDCRRGNG